MSKLVISVITPNFNGERFLEQTLRSVLNQRSAAFDLEYIVADGGSRDHSMDIVETYRGELAHVIHEPDHGPADAINKGLRKATGDIIAWLNADDLYRPDALTRVAQAMEEHPSRALCFGHCPIVDEAGTEIRRGITRFKEAFFPFSSRFTIQCINYISQPATFFRRAAFEKTGYLREDLTCAWDYDFVTRMWHHGGAACLGGAPLAAFRWHEGSLSGQHFRRQFKEEWDVAAADAGRFSPQALIHLGVRWGIVWSYTTMEWFRRHRGATST
jgi:glycosyltransferase involved in cell wall biosynthesis